MTCDSSFKLVAVIDRRAEILEVGLLVGVVVHLPIAGRARAIWSSGVKQVAQDGVTRQEMKRMTSSRNRLVMSWSEVNVVSRVKLPSNPNALRSLIAFSTFRLMNWSCELNSEWSMYSANWNCR